MQIDIHARHFSLTNAMKNYTKCQLDFALAEREHYIQRVIIRLSDINGPRGGRDKRCLLLITLVNLPTVVIDNIEKDLYFSIDQAIDRASQAVERKIERQQSSRKIKLKLVA